MPWRWPRIMAALFAGVMLAVAGCIIQRLAGNPMASPEVLGISSGAAFGVVLMLFLVPHAHCQRVTITRKRQAARGIKIVTVSFSVTVLVFWFLKNTSMRKRVVQKFMLKSLVSV